LGGEMLMTIHTVSGQPVWHKTLTAVPGANHFMVEASDIQKLSKGVFLLTVSNATGRVFRRIVKMN